jgi:flagellar protein FliS
MHEAGGHRQYREADVRSATPEKLVVLLYGKLTRDLEEARAAQAAGDVARGVDRAHHARLIVTELAQALDPAHDADLAADLAGLYEYVQHETTLYLADRDPERLVRCLRVVAPLRDAWSRASGGGPDAQAAAPAERPAHLFSVSA